MNLGIFGATGRLGRMIGLEALKHVDMRITAALGRSSVGVDYGSFLGGEVLGTMIQVTPKEPLPDLFIDVSLAVGLEERLKYGRPMVIGTTGFSEADRGLIEESARKVPIFYASNFSLGMAVLKKLASDLANLFPEGVRMEITETHHAGKRDAPSGSALSLVEAIQKVQPGVEIPIESVRLGDAVGEHVLRFILPEERVQLSHEALSRRAFAQGALAAARFLLGKPPGLYGMDELLAEKKEAGAS